MPRQAPHPPLSSTDTMHQFSEVPTARPVMWDDITREREEESNEERRLIQQARPLSRNQRQEQSRFSSSTSSGRAAIHPCAPVPLSARSILTKLLARLLLPRAKEVGMVVDSLVVVDDGTCRVRRRINASDGSSMEESSSSNRRSSVSDYSPQSSHLSPRRSLQEMVFDSTKFVTIIIGIGGTGKTTVAAIVASRTDVREAFCDGIVWMTLGQRRHVWGAEASGRKALTYQEYQYYLLTICHQLDMAPPSFDDPILLSGDEDSMRRHKTLQSMYDAKQDMTNLLHKMNILIVLDDLWHPSDLEWFQFANRPNSRLRLLVTTRVGGSQAHRQIRKNSLVERNENHLLNGDIHEENTNHEWISQEVVIHLRALQEEEAVQLLLSEASPFQSRQRRRKPTCPDKYYSEDERRHAITIVRGCHYLPVAIHSIERVLSAVLPMPGDFHTSKTRDLKWLASKMSDDCSRSLDPSMNSEGKSRDENRDIYDVFDRSFSSQLHGDVISVALKICYATFAVTFSRPDCERPWIPITPIELLWDGIMTEEERQALNYDQNKIKTVKLLEQMEALGLLDSKVSTVMGEKENLGTLATAGVISYRVHHALMLQYARQVLEDQTRTLRSTGISRRFWRSGFFTGISMALSLSFGTQCGAPQISGDVASVSRQLDALVFWGYKKRREEKMEMQWKMAISDDSYVYRFLPLHMIRVGGKRMLKEAFQLLQDEGFITARVESMGSIDGTNAHIKDVEMIRQIHGVEKKKDFQYGEANFIFGFLDSEVLLTYDKIRNFLKRRLTTAESLLRQKSGLTWSGVALFSIGVSLQKQNLWIHALDVFAEALEMLKSSGLDNTNPIVKRAYLHANAFTCPKVVLVTRDSPLCIRLKNADRLIDFTDVKSSTKDIEGIQLELNSHPGLGIVLTRPQSCGWLGANMYQLGIGPKESSIYLCRRGNLLCRAGHDTVFSTFNTPCEGDSVFLCPLSYIDLKLKKKVAWNVWHLQICGQQRCNNVTTRKP